MLRLKMAAHEDLHDKTNPFHWFWVDINLPGPENYRPHLPWAMKVRWDGHLAAELFKYADDTRVAAFCLELCVELLGSPYYKGVPLSRIPSVRKPGMKSA